MTKYLLALAMVTAMGGMAQAHWDPAKTAHPKVYVCTVNSPVVNGDNTLNVRTRPNGPILGQYTNGDEVTLQDQQGDWVFVTANMDNHMQGWVYGPYLTDCTKDN
jgi:hypothetical protein